MSSIHNATFDNGVRYRIEQRSGLNSEQWVTYRCGQIFRDRAAAHRQAARVADRVGEHNIRVVSCDRDGLPL